jgi:hypothetical protein
VNNYLSLVLFELLKTFSIIGITSFIFISFLGSYIRTTTNLKGQDLTIRDAIPILSEGLTDVLPSLSVR